MNAHKKIAVAGATGRVGSHLVDILESEGHDVVSIARSRGVDVITGEGLDEALAGVDVLIDAATGPSPEEQAATEFFTIEVWTGRGLTRFAVLFIIELSTRRVEIAGIVSEPDSAWMTAAFLSR